MKSLLRPSLTVLGLALGLGVGFVAAPACTDVEAECKTICDVLATCNMLPSPLGIADNKGVVSWSAQQNCQARCMASDPKEVGQMARCMPIIKQTEPHVQWCSSNGECNMAAECLEQIFDDHRVGGLGTAAVEFVNVELFDPEAEGMDIPPYSVRRALLESALTDCEDPETADSLITEATFPINADEFCEGLDIERVEVILTSTEELHVIATGSCSDILGTSQISEPIPVGRYQTSVRIYQNGGGPGSTGQCSQFYGQPVVIPAGNGICESGTCFAQIPLPTEFSCTTANDNRTCEPNSGGKNASANCGFPCEGGPDSCSIVCEQTDLDCIDAANDDIEGNECEIGTYVQTCGQVGQGVDDDCNGLSNCNDPVCSVDCTESGPRCNDCIDNDNDGYTDCDDKDCADATVCTEGGESLCSDTADTDTETAGESMDTTDTGTTDTGTDSTGTDSTGTDSTGTTDTGTDSTG